MSKRRRHILVAEDDSFLIEIMIKTLRKHGVRVSGARNGQDAIDIIERDPPDLLLLDLLMPLVDGYAVLQHRKKQNMRFPVVVCTNLSDNMNESKCRTLGASGFFVKSDIDHEQLWTILKKHLS